jgi:hypothetical protein
LADEGAELITATAVLASTSQPVTEGVQEVLEIREMAATAQPLLTSGSISLDEALAISAELAAEGWTPEEIDDYFS